MHWLCKRGWKILKSFSHSLIWMRDRFFFIIYFLNSNKGQNKVLSIFVFRLFEISDDFFLLKIALLLLDKRLSINNFNGIDIFFWFIEKQNSNLILIFLVILLFIFSFFSTINLLNFSFTFRYKANLDKRQNNVQG